MLFSHHRLELLHNPPEPHSYPIPSYHTHTPLLTISQSSPIRIPPPPLLSLSPPSVSQSTSKQHTTPIYLSTDLAITLSVFLNKEINETNTVRNSDLAFLG